MSPALKLLQTNLDAPFLGSPLRMSFNIRVRDSLVAGTIQIRSADLVCKELGRKHGFGVSILGRYATKGHVEEPNRSEEQVYKGRNPHRQRAGHSEVSMLPCVVAGARVHDDDVFGGERLAALAVLLYHLPQRSHAAHAAV